MICKRFMEGSKEFKCKYFLTFVPFFSKYKLFFLLSRPAYQTFSNSKTTDMI